MFRKRSIAGCCCYSRTHNRALTPWTACVIFITSRWLLEVGMDLERSPVWDGAQVWAECFSHHITSERVMVVLHMWLIVLRTSPSDLQLGPTVFSWTSTCEISLDQKMHHFSKVPPFVEDLVQDVWLYKVHVKYLFVFQRWFLSWFLSHRCPTGGHGDVSSIFMHSLCLNPYGQSGSFLPVGLNADSKSPPGWMAVCLFISGPVIPCLSATVSCHRLQPPRDPDWVSAADNGRMDGLILTSDVFLPMTDISR